MRWLVYPALLSSLTACQQDVPTSVLLHVERGTGLPDPDTLRLTIYSSEGMALTGQRLPATGKPSLPGQVVLYPPQGSGTLRLHLQASLASARVGEGAATVELRSGQQVAVTISVDPGRLVDRDGDGVPDLIDNCPDHANPEQGPCPSLDAGADLATDGQLPDGRTDTGPSDQRIDRGPHKDEGVDLVPSPDLGADIGPDAFVCPCPLGCRQGGSVCRRVVPANGYVAGTYLNVPTISGAAAVDTTTCVLKYGPTSIVGVAQQPTGTLACVLSLQSLVISTTGSLVVRGDAPLVLLIAQGAKIDGLIDASARGATPGPGGGGGGVAPVGGPGQDGVGPGGGKTCSCGPTGGVDDCGGGGGGFATVGAAGGDEAPGCPTTSEGGLGYGSATLTPLVAGSGGASGGQFSTGQPTGQGGAGGGAVQISCQGSISVQGVINAGGGGGIAGPVGGATSIAGGGGGSGGGVLLQGSDISGTGLVAVNGGGGAASGTGACGPGGDGEDGAAAVKAAQGGAAGTGCGAGGAGGWGSSVPQSGDTTVHGGGGGGGAVGRIRLEWVGHGATAPIGASGKVSLGEVSVQ